MCLLSSSKSFSSKSVAFRGLLNTADILTFCQDKFRIGSCIIDVKINFKKRKKPNSVCIMI